MKPKERSRVHLKKGVKFILSKKVRVKFINKRENVGTLSQKKKKRENLGIIFFFQKPKIKLKFETTKLISF